MTSDNWLAEVAAAKMRLSTQCHGSSGDAMAMTLICYGSGVTETCVCVWGGGVAFECKPSQFSGSGAASSHFWGE